MYICIYYILCDKEVCASTTPNKPLYMCPHTAEYYYMCPHTWEKKKKCVPRRLLTSHRGSC